MAFALAPALRARLLGTGLVAIGTIVLIAMLLTWLADLPTAVVTGLVVLAVVGVVALGLLVGVRHWVLRLDEHGYRVRGAPHCRGEVGTVDRRARPAGDDRVPASGASYSACATAVRRPCRSTRSRAVPPSWSRPSPTISTVDTGTADCAETTGQPPLGQPEFPGVLGDG